MSNPYAISNSGFSDGYYMNPDDFRPGWTFLACVAAGLSLLFS